MELFQSLEAKPSTITSMYERLAVSFQWRALTNVKDVSLAGKLPILFATGIITFVMVQPTTSNSLNLQLSESLLAFNTF